MKLLSFTALRSASTEALLPNERRDEELKITDVLEHSKRAMWICAHPDDENSSGGLLARARDTCVELYMVSLTRGENSGAPGGALVWNGLGLGSQIGASREVLFREAAGILQAEDCELGPFVNGPHSIEYLDNLTKETPYSDWPRGSRSDDVIAKWSKEGDPLGYVVGLLRRWRPDVALSMDHWCGASGHPEHLAVARLLLQAIPIAKDPSAYPEAGAPWGVKYVIFTAYLLPEYRDLIIEFKAEGDEPIEPIEEISSLDDSATHGTTYLGVACRVARNYENTMHERGWSEEQMRELCADTERNAARAFQNNIKPFPIIEPYRVRPFV